MIGDFCSAPNPPALKNAVPLQVGWTFGHLMGSWGLDIVLSICLHLHFAGGTDPLLCGGFMNTGWPPPQHYDCVYYDKVSGNWATHAAVAPRALAGSDYSDDWGLIAIGGVVRKNQT